MTKDSMTPQDTAEGGVGEIIPTGHPMTLEELIARLEKVTGPDRELDYAVWAVVVPEEPHDDDLPRKLNIEYPPRYTSSIDAALTLVLPGWTWSMMHGDDVIDAYLTLPKRGAPPTREVDVHDAVSPALALCIAALKSRLPL